ncbi:hypothetical protein [Streptomyces sp. AS58]|uniref:hypothetical protein n=1 Tax=Streptomyces sp. AS58 TaxID=1519489 RepID=UPI00131D6BAA|nr:hypothetical protein [Streptomyces sp. AS58]
MESGPESRPPGREKEAEMRRNKFGFATVCAVSAMTLWLTGCSGQESDQEKNSGGNSVSDKRAKAYDCLREKGAEVKSGVSGGLGQILPGELSAKEFQQALKDCQVAGGGSGAGAGGGLSPKAKEQMLAFAACMRKEGFDHPDPEFVDGAAKMPTVKIPDSRRSEYQAASAACSKDFG